MTDPQPDTRPYLADALDSVLDLFPIPPEAVLEGDPRAAIIPFVVEHGVEVGIWEITPGAAQDVETDEVFVVLSGRGVITFVDGDTIAVGPGSLVRLFAGERTIWKIHETLRKVYFVLPEGTDSSTVRGM